MSVITDMMTREQKINEAVKRLQLCIEEHETESLGRIYYTVDKKKAKQVLEDIF